MIIGRIEIKDSALAALLSACFALPIVLFHVLNYPATPTFLLAPLIAWAAFQKRRSAALKLYVIAAISGLASCLIADRLRPDGELTRHILSLVLLMFTISFLFLGRWAGERFSIAQLARLLGVFSAVFCIALAARLLISGETFRVYVGPLGLAELNAAFLGLPVAWTAGVLSLAQLLLMQSLLCLGGIFGKDESVVERTLCAVGFACALILVLKSEARSAQIGLVIPALALAWALLFYRPKRLPLVAVALTIAVAGSVVMNGTVAERLSESATVVSQGGETEMFERVPAGAESSTSGRSREDSSSVPVSKDEDVAYNASLANVSNGRFALYTAAVTDILANPWIGTGFGSWGRFSVNKINKTVAASTQTHIYWLTLLWKGGLLFLVPIMAFFAITYFDALRDWKALLEPDRFFLFSAVIAAHAMCFFWDLLNVPTAGALAFFIIGLLPGRSQQA